MQGGFAGQRLVARDITGRLGPAQTMDVRDYAGVKRVFAPKAQVLAVFQAIEGAGVKGTELAALSRLIQALGIAPAMAAGERDALYRQWTRAVERARGWED